MGGFEMGKYKEAKESAYMWSLIMILVGVVLILLGKISDIDNTINEVLEFMGITFISVFAVSLIYQRFVAEKHFEEFKKLLAIELKKLDSIQSKCMKLGIVEIFETMLAYVGEYSLRKIVEQTPENGKITCIANALFYLLNKTDEIKEGLEKGLTFELACVDPAKITPSVEKTFLLSDLDIYASLTVLKDLLSWAIKTKAKGSLELRYYWPYFPDTVLIFTSNDGTEKLAWNLSFGRDFAQKRTIILDTDYPLGKDLKSRYMSRYQNATSQIQFINGKIEQNNFDWKFNGNVI